MTQADIVLKHLKRKKTLTSITAFKHYSITRLAARVHELRRKGVKINSKRMTKGNKTYASYSLAN